MAFDLHRTARVFHVADGSFVRHVAVGLCEPYDVEECEGGWFSACDGSHTIDFVRHGDGGGVVRARLGKWGSGDRVFDGPCVLSLVPGLGMVVRELGNGGRLLVFASPDVVAMASMSAARVAWMVGVARGVCHRRTAVM